ncbi:MAG: serine dehydratase subunit alpha family protein [Synergistales bacterium]|nr:serine dehydratase subunit alpha family protein [Synergistales bacterium]
MFTIKEFLAQEVKPALGCTEPGAVALAVAKATETLAEKVSTVSITVSDSIFKNGVAVGIPGTGGLRGNVIAAALAVVCGKSDYGLEVLRDTDRDSIELAQKMVQDGVVSLEADMARHGVYVMAQVAGNGHDAACVIEGTHTNIVTVKKDGKTLFQRDDSGNASSTRLISDQVVDMTYSDLVAMASDLDDEDVETVMAGVDMNIEIANYGLTNDVGLGLGKTVKAIAGDLYERDLPSQIRAIAAAASDARMDGAPLPVMSSAGSGNHGLTAILPVYVAGRFHGKSRGEIAEAIAFSHLSTSFTKSRMGRLSPVCGCAVAAGAGAAAGIVHLMGGSLQQSVRAMELVLGNLVGMVCDGAKETCSLKVSTGSAEAYFAAMVALDGKYLKGAQGVVDPSDISKTVDNAVALNVRGMKDVDRVIIEIISKRM